MSPRYVRKDRSLLMHGLDIVLHPFVPDFMTRFWTTLGGTIYYPEGVPDPLAKEHDGIRAHEMVHFNQWQEHPICMVLLYLFFPLPFLFSGRWFIERPAYLLDILSGRFTVDAAVDSLWRSYLWPWPRPLMRAWFEARRR